MGRSHPVDEKFLYTLGEVRRVLWHPDSFSHILILLSDNTIRLYNIGLKSGAKLVKIFTIGPKPSWLLAGKGILESLGDTAVDFTPVPCTNELLVLRGNGDVYMITCDIECKSPLPPKLHGPLTMYPPADDNYGEDSCCIITIGGTSGEPPLIVIATSSALLYHCLLLPDTPCDDDQYKSGKKDGPGYSLYVVEAVELNTSLGPEEVQLKHSYPVHLYPCMGNSGSYVCMHAAGVHSVMLLIVQQLKAYTFADDSLRYLARIVTKLLILSNAFVLSLLYGFVPVNFSLSTSSIDEIETSVNHALSSVRSALRGVCTADAASCVRGLALRARHFRL
ncbi:Nuclear pore complex protein Nup88 [Eumeta japonica]|uniref:Nuclear pore complex protein Nup88 n=1 Tax=Eumeta variegata TaxID=151549 RepID=A0A4C1XR50_EUMVA|nr:Nuclear pore complex protein Nup88 [Eumeta japonica]